MAMHVIRNNTPSPRLSRKQELVQQSGHEGEETDVLFRGEPGWSETWGAGAGEWQRQPWLEA
jgi:hypothetical protein